MFWEQTVYFIIIIIPYLHKQLDISNQEFIFGKRTKYGHYEITDSQWSKKNTTRCKKHWKQSETADGVGGGKTWNSNKLE